MKKLVLSVMAAVFAVAVQAGTEKSGTSTSSCCAAATSQTKADCSMGKDGKGCCSMEKTTKTACTKPILKSPKALG